MGFAFHNFSSPPPSQGGEHRPCEAGATLLGGNQTNLLT